MKTPYLSFGTTTTLVELYLLVLAGLAVAVIFSCIGWWPGLQCSHAGWSFAGWTTIGVGIIICIVRHPEW
jgi:hypothetical protein